MSSPWKSLDGGSIHKVGSSYATGNGAATIVAAATNVNGLIIWTGFIKSTNNSGDLGQLKAGTSMLIMANQNGVQMLNAPIFIPAGVEIVSNAQCYIYTFTYDIL